MAPHPSTAPVLEQSAEAATLLHRPTYDCAVAAPLACDAVIQSSTVIPPYLAPFSTWVYL